MAEWRRADSHKHGPRTLEAGRAACYERTSGALVSARRRERVREPGCAQQLRPPSPEWVGGGLGGRFRECAPDGVGRASSVAPPRPSVHNSLVPPVHWRCTPLRQGRSASFFRASRIFILWISPSGPRRPPATPQRLRIRPCWPCIGNSPSLHCSFFSVPCGSPSTTSAALRRTFPSSLCPQLRARLVQGSRRWIYAVVARSRSRGRWPRHLPRRLGASEGLRVDSEFLALVAVASVLPWSSLVGASLDF